MNNLNLFSKIKFFWKKPKVIIITGENRKTAKETILWVLKKYFSIGKEILIFESDLNNIKKFNFIVKNSLLPVLVVTSLNNNFFDKIQAIFSKMPSQGFLVLNFDDEKLKELKTESSANFLTYGFQERADFKASDVKLNEGINFKINYKGHVVPVWLDKIFGEEKIYAALSAITVGVILGLNLVEISQALKGFKAESVDNCNKIS